MHDGLDPTIIIFALLAIFVVWKLKSVLGTRVDIEKRPPPSSSSSRSGDAGNSANVVRLPGAAERPVESEQPKQDERLDLYAKTEKGRADLIAVMGADPKFDIAHFVGGAKAAYEVIITAFAEGDKKTLGNLLSPEVLTNFSAVIDQREAAGQKASTKLVSIDSVEVVEATVKNSTAQISARIAAKMISATLDSAGAVIAGDPETVVSTDDVWTFARPIGSRDPTWRLIATESGQ